MRRPKAARSRRRTKSRSLKILRKKRLPKNPPRKNLLRASLPKSLPEKRARVKRAQAGRQAKTNSGRGSLIRKRAKRAFVASQRARRIAQFAQILHFAKNARFR